MHRSPIVETLTALLRSKLADGARIANELSDDCWASDYIVISYQQQFEKLWDILQSPLKTLAHKLDIVLVWDGVPTHAQDVVADSVALHSWLTVYDWLVTFALLAARMPGSPSPFRFFVIDLAPTKLQPVPQKVSAKMINLLPWIRLYSLSLPNEPALRQVSRALGKSASRLLHHDLDLEQLVSDLGLTGPSSDLPTMAEGLGEIDSLRALWTNELTKPERRHSISNLIAPLLLANELETAGVEAADTVLQSTLTPPIQRLSELLAHLDLMPSQDASSPASQAGRGTWKPLTEEDFVKTDIFGTFRYNETPCVKFLLVDDHANDYKDVLRDVVSPFPLYTEETPETLASWLDHVGSSCFDGGQVNVIGRADRLIENPTLVGFDVLLLDLRLFNPDAPRGVEKRREFFNRLVGLGAENADHSHRQLVQDLVRSARKMLEGSSSQRSIDYLALLPVLLALADPSLPIVIFSSTRQRDVIENFARFPNIITTFAKPVVSGYETDRTGYIRRLRLALVRALRLHENRALWRRIAELPTKGNPPRTLISARPDKETERPETKDDVKFAKRVENAYFNLDTIDPAFNSPKSEIWGWKAIRKTLRAYFERYVLSGNYHDFASLPYEFLEIACAPPQKRIPRDPFWRQARIEINPGIGIELFKFWREFPAKIDMLARETKIERDKKEVGVFSLPVFRNYLADGLQHIRHRKAHGYGPIPINATGTPPDAEEFRISSLLELSTLIDFLLGQQRSDSTSLAWEELCTAIAFAKRVPANTFHPAPLTASSEVRWDDFVLFTLAWAYSKAPRYYSQTTADALFKYLRHLGWFTHSTSPTKSSSVLVPISHALHEGTFIKSSSWQVELKAGTTVEVTKEHFARGGWPTGTKVLLWLRNNEPWHVELLKDIS